VSGPRREAAYDNASQSLIPRVVADADLGAAVVITGLFAARTREADSVPERG
jgi:hypothetical protein